MAIPTSRTKEPGSVTIDLEKCDGCGLCVKVCGAVHPFIENSGARRLREKYGIRYTSREGLLVIFGYPALRYRKGIKRSFASVTKYASKRSNNST